MNNDIRDIKSPVDIPHHWMWVWIAIAVAIILGVAVWMFLKYFKRPKEEDAAAPVVVIPAWDRAYGRLQGLAVKNLLSRTYLKQFYTELSDIVRHYLEERFNLKAPEMTTEEFLDSLKDSAVLNESQQQLLKEFLYSCDMIKFAKYESTTTEAEKSFDIVKQLVDQTRGT